VALFWFAFSLPFAGVNLLLTRSFFAVRRPWIPTSLAALNMVVDIVVSIVLYKPLGIAGLVIGTALANIVMTWLQLDRLRLGLGGRLEGRQTLMITLRILAATAVMAALARGIWVVANSIVGTSLIGQLISVGLAVVVSVALYAKIVLLMRIPEAEQIQRLILERLRPA
jgi:putative peptidoglycan lipid II flippase